jgi:dihydrofolate synthase/folylpolyglutamate synthase
MSPVPSADEILAGLEPLGMRQTLGPFRRLLSALDEPQRDLAVVLVAGTNGKGSTAALLAGISCAAGYRTGLYTSPHLEEARERIRIDGLALPTLELDRILQGVVRAAGDELPTPFEALTAAAFLAFAEAQVELAVMEVGLGGRLDATNAAEPVLSLVTEIGLDHVAQLGSSLERIAFEKGGIFRASRPALAWVTAAEAVAGLRRAAAASGADLELLPEEWRAQTRARGQHGQRVRLGGPTGGRDLLLPLAGAHQRGNLVLAIAAAEDLSVVGWPRLVDSIGRGVAGTRWPGRLEGVALPGGCRVLIDGAHNPHAMAALTAELHERAEPFALVFGALADKDVEAMAAAIAPVARRTWVAPPSSPRAMTTGTLVALPALAGATACADAGAALDAALEAGEELVVVTGSLYLAGEARRALRERFGAPPPAAEIPAWEEPTGKAPAPATASPATAS